MTRNRTLIYFFLIIGSLACLVIFSIIVLLVLRVSRSAGFSPESPNPPLIFPTGSSETNPPTPLNPTLITPQVLETPSQQSTKAANLPAPSGKIAFTCQIFKDSRYNQICLMNADGSNSHRLTTEDEFDHIYPSLAPDGQSLVFSANMTGGYEIYSLDWQGNQAQVTDEKLEGKFGAFAPEISPDGKSIVYARIASDKDKSIWILDRASGQTHWVFGSIDSGGWDPSWSPDGTRILFMSDRSGSDQLHTIAVDGSDIRQITDMPDLRGRNDWSPDGYTIGTYVGGPWTREIVLMNPDGSNIRYLTDGGNNLAPSFSPDGQWVAMTSYKDNYQEINGCEIYIIRIDGSDLRRLTDNDYCDWQPRWGP